MQCHQLPELEALSHLHEASWQEITRLPGKTKHNIAISNMNNTVGNYNVLSKLQH
jgi:hypothetical protein